MGTQINIAIDGPSASGKSTIAKALAYKLGYLYIDTGAMYRCIALYVLDHEIDPNDEFAVSKQLRSIDIKLDSYGHYYLNGTDVSQRIRENDIALVTSEISQYSDVRRFLLDYQRSFIRNKGCIMDGRDIGTVVMPDAELKIFQIASADQRAERRYLELVKNDPSVKYDDVYQDILTRDYQDSHRVLSPLVKASDAIEIDTSEATIDEVVNQIYTLALERMN